ncbi:hypothetical protein ABBQ38_012062 [Trebouxia sp. C0009 RCD-2024]
MEKAAAASARLRTTLLMNLASVVEKADEQVLPAVYYFIGRSLNATPAQLGTLTLCRALVQAMVSCAFNGLGLALVIPCVQSLVADYHPSESRGKAFGFMFFTASCGGMVGGFFATNIGSTMPFGMDGWRFAFHLMAMVSLVTSGLVFYMATDPRPAARNFISPLILSASAPLPLSTSAAEFPPPPASKRSSLNSHLGWGARLKEAWREISAVLHIRTFQIIILQGIVGSTPWNAMVFFTLWLQLLGFTDYSASVLMALFAGGCAIGSAVGGYLGDVLSKRWPNAGRIMTAQLSVLLSLPLSCILLKGLPTHDVGHRTAMRSLYALVMFLFGLCISWCGSNNSAMFADIVPEHLRSTVYAFDRSFEGAVAACAAPLVGLVAEQCFGFQGSVSTGEADVERDHTNARALGNSLLVCLLVPWSLCLLSYTGLYITYPHDKRNAKKVGLSETLLEGANLLNK